MSVYVFTDVSLFDAVSVYLQVFISWMLYQFIYRCLAVYVALSVYLQVFSCLMLYQFIYSIIGVSSLSLYQFT